MLTVRKPIGRETPTQHLIPEEQRWDIGCGKGADVYAGLMLRCHGAMTIGVADCTALQGYAMQRILRSLRIFAESKEGNLEANIASYVAQGVNDGVAGRTCSYGGVQLADEALRDQGTPIDITEPALTQGVQPVNIVFPIRFINPRARNPWGTCLDARKLRSFYVTAMQGIASTTAAGDDTDVLVTDATTTVVAALNWDLGAVVLKKAPAGLAFDTRKRRTITQELATGAAQLMKIGEGTIYRQIGLICTDDDVPSDARVVEVAAHVDRFADDVWGRWCELRGEEKSDYGLAAVPAGHNVLRFPSGLDVRGANSFELKLNVAAGAVVAADRLFALAEEIVPARVPVAAVTGFGRRKGKGKRRR